MEFKFNINWQKQYFDDNIIPEIEKQSKVLKASSKEVYTDKLDPHLEVTVVIKDGLTQDKLMQVVFNIGAAVYSY